MALTPEQFNQLATKDDLKGLVAEQKFQDKTDKIVNKLFTLGDRVEKIERTMATKQDHNEVMNTLDAVMKKLDTIILLITPKNMTAIFTRQIISGQDAREILSA